MCVCVIAYTSQCNMASRKGKTIGCKSEEELADAVNEIVMTVIQIQIIFPNFQLVKRVNLKVQVREMSVTFQYRALAADRKCYPNYRVF